MEQRIGFGPRLGALLIDCVLVGVLVAVLGGVVGGMFGAAAGGAGAAISTSSGKDAQSAVAMGGMIGALAGMIIAAAVLGLAYFLIEGFTGYTLGKLMLGMRIASADGTQAPVSTRSRSRSRSTGRSPTSTSSTASSPWPPPISARARTT